MVAAMKHNYSFVQTLNYVKPVAKKYGFRKPVRLDAHLSDIMPIQPGSYKFGAIMKCFDDIQNHFGIQLAYRKGLKITTVRDFVLLVHRLSHNKMK